jgi:hypothetical protein
MEETSKTRQQMDREVDESNLKHLSLNRPPNTWLPRKRREKADKDGRKEYGPCRVADPFENPLGVIR